MKKHMLLKDFLQEVKKTKNRFLSILLIAGLGVAFLSGIRAASPDMKLSADAFYDESRLMDVRVMGTLGLTEEDVKEVEQLPGVQEAEASYSADVFCEGEESQQVLKLMALTEKMNLVTVKEGRLPERSGEIFVDDQFLENQGYEIGDTLTLKSGTESDLEDTLAFSQFEIVGAGSSPFYLSLDRGSTSIGNGNVSGFAFIRPEDFSLDIYTELYIRAEGASEEICYSDDYTDRIDVLQEQVEAIAGERCEIRYADVKKEAEDQIADGERQVEDARTQLSGARAQLDDGWQELTDGKEELEENRQILSDSRAQLLEGQQALKDGKSQIEASEQQLSQAREQITSGSGQVASGREQLSQATETLTEKQEELAAGREALEAGKTELEENKKILQGKQEELEAGKEALAQAENVLAEQEEKLSQMAPQIEEARAAIPVLEQQITGLESQIEDVKKEIEALPPEDTQQLEQLKEQLAGLEEQKSALEEQLTGLKSRVEAYDQGISQLAAAREALEEQKGQLVEAESELDSGWEALAQAEAELSAQEQVLSDGEAQLNAGWMELAGQEEKLNQSEAALSLAREQLRQGEGKLAAAREEIASKEQLIADSEAELSDGERALTDGEQKIADSELELQEGEEEYQEQAGEAEQKIAEAEGKLADAREALAELKEPEWYVLDRGSIQTYVEYEQDAMRIDAIGKVFPAIFFLVAALVCLTTMTRMVEENRTQVGTLKALGYGKTAIAGKYIGYAFSASLLGGLGGLVLGQKLLPVVIIDAYGILYTNLPRALNPIYGGLSFYSTGIAVAVTTAAALFACFHELKEVPAQLMRPEAPKNGKRVFLERLGFLWKRLNFTQKSTVRNLIRYKKRFFMTVLGIGGCMGLLLVGFGLKDSIMAIGDRQFGYIRTYSSTLALEEDAGEAEKTALMERARQDSQIEEAMWAYEKTIDVGKGEKEKSSYLTVIEDTGKLPDFIALQDRTTKEKYELDDSGVIVTEKLAKLLDLSAGDTIWLKEGERARVEVTVSHVVENYYFHYIYMTESLYEQLYGETPEYNEILTVNEADDEAFEEQFQERYMKEDGVLNVSFIGSISDRVEDMLKSMNTVIYVLVIAAGLLAFIVLYNLNNINISERKRELATLKVLGFYDREVTGYVTRENLCLTLIGCAAGVVIGQILHRYIIVTAEIDLMMFGREINGISYVISILLTFLFSVIVNVFMHFHLKKVDMVESMKSVE